MLYRLLPNNSMEPTRPAGRYRLGGQDRLAKDAVVEDFADDFELGEFGHRQVVGLRYT